MAEPATACTTYSNGKQAKLFNLLFLEINFQKHIACVWFKGRMHSSSSCESRGRRCSSNRSSVVCG